MLHTADLPPISKAVLPTLPELKYGFEWFRDSKPYRRRHYQRTRQALVREQAGFREEFALECHQGDQTLRTIDRTDAVYSKLGDVRVLKTSGTTGRKKQYLWGPHFIDVNRFYFGLCREGDRLHKAVRLSVGEFRDNGGESSFLVKDLPADFIGYSKIVVVNVKSRGPVKGLKEALAGYNVSLFPTAWAMLDQAAELTHALDPEAILHFTGEAMPAGMLQALRKRGLDARDSMRCWDGGATFFTCKHGNRHWCEFLSTVEFDPDDTLVTSDLFNLTQPHLGYRNGDVVKSTPQGTCACGLETVGLDFKSRQDTIYFGTPDGFRCNYEGLLFLLDRAAKEVGVKVEIACFGCDPGGTLPLKVLYGVSGPESKIRDFERAGAAQYEKEFGFKRVEFQSGLDRFTNKCKKMFYYTKEQ